MSDGLYWCLTGIEGVVGICRIGCVNIYLSGSQSSQQWFCCRHGQWWHPQDVTWIPLPLSTMGMRTATLSPTAHALRSIRLRLTMRSACDICVSLARLLCWATSLRRDSSAESDDGLTLGTWLWSCWRPGLETRHGGAGIAAGAAEGAGRGSWWVSAMTLSVSGVAGCKVGSSSVDSVTDTWRSVVAYVGVLRTDRRSSSVSSLSSFSDRRLEDVSPSFGSVPNFAVYGVRLMPEWYTELFMFCIKRRTMDQSCVLLSVIQAGCGCLGFPWTMLSWGQSSCSSLITVNSEPLSICSIAGATNRRKISSSWKATSAARFEVRSRMFHNFVRWHLKIHLKSDWGDDCVSIRSAWLREPKYLYRICFTTTRFSHWSLSFLVAYRTECSTASMVMLAYLVPECFIILPQPPWPVATCALWMTSYVFSMHT